MSQNSPDDLSTSQNPRSNMDRKISKKSAKYKKPIILALCALIVSVITWQLLQDDQGKIYKIERANLVISTVTSGEFEDFLPIRSKVAPLKTVYLDAIEGGRVEKVLIESGTIVEKGQPIVILSNTQLQLDVMRNEAAVTEQLNNMRNIELSLEQNRLGHKRNLIELEYQIKRLTRQVKREQTIFEKGSISNSTLQESQDLLDYNTKKYHLTLESQRTDALMQEQQLTFLKDTAVRLQDSLRFATDNMDNLNMKAPVTGKLSGFDIIVGQSISRGERLGQIDDPDSFKLEASIDEFYLERVELEQPASVMRNGNRYELQVSKIYPQVKNGQFQVDLTFNDQQPAGIRRGQNLPTKLTLGDSSKVKLIKNGAFYQDTAGSWVFVVSADNQTATKRTVKLGRRNNQYIEVLDGLYDNEKVITSPYTSFKQMDTLKLINNN